MLRRPQEFIQALVMRSLLSFSAVALLACVSDSTEGGGPGGGVSGTPTVELGAGRTSYEELPEEGARLEVVSGPQGGWHFEHTLLISGFDPEGAVVEYTVQDPSTGASIAFDAVYVLRRKGLVETEDGQLLRVGDRTVLDIASPAEVVGRTFDLRCVASRDGEAFAEDSVRFLATDDVDELE
jgi:hypothetical protein